MHDKIDVGGASHPSHILNVDPSTDRHDLHGSVDPQIIGSRIQPSEGSVSKSVSKFTSWEFQL